MGTIAKYIENWQLTLSGMEGGLKDRVGLQILPWGGDNGTLGGTQEIMV